MAQAKCAHRLAPSGHRERILPSLLRLSQPGEHWLSCYVDDRLDQY
jgi:hypothetical protein